MESAESQRVRAAVRLTELRRRIERWRWRRAKRSPMPAELWTAATELARELGAYRVAREAGVGYPSLRARLGDAAEKGRPRADAFVEIDTGALFASPPATVRGEVELSDASGMKVVIRLGAGESVDLAGVLGAFRAVQR
jgi:hypothetical protein